MILWKWMEMVNAAPAGSGWNLVVAAPVQGLTMTKHWPSIKIYCIKYGNLYGILRGVMTSTAGWGFQDVSSTVFGIFNMFQPCLGRWLGEGSDSYFQGSKTFETTSQTGLWVWALERNIGWKPRNMGSEKRSSGLGFAFVWPQIWNSLGCAPKFRTDPIQYDIRLISWRYLISPSRVT